jgi:hypothetical protein
VPLLAENSNAGGAVKRKARLETRRHIVIVQHDDVFWQADRGSSYTEATQILPGWISSEIHFTDQMIAWLTINRTNESEYSCCKKDGSHELHSDAIRSTGCVMAKHVRRSKVIENY